MIRPRAGTVFGILSLVGFALLFVSLPGASSRPAVSVWNLGHVFLFYCATQWALRSRPEIARLPASTRTLGLLAAAAVLGGTTEVLQGFVGRSSEWGDVGRDVLGAAAGLVFFSPLPVADSLRNRRRWAAGVAVGLLVALVPLGRALWDVWAALRELPTLSDFEGARELERWEGSAVLSISEEIHRSGRRSLRVDLGTQEYSGAFLTRFPGDWRDY